MILQHALAIWEILSYINSSLTGSPDSFVKKMSAKYTILSNHNLPVGRPFKQKYGSMKKQLVQLASQTIMPVHFLKITLYFGVQQKCCVCTYHIVTPNRKKYSSRDLLKLICTAPSGSS